MVKSSCSVRVRGLKRKFHLKNQACHLEGKEQSNHQWFNLCSRSKLKFALYSIKTITLLFIEVSSYPVYVLYSFCELLFEFDRAFWLDVYRKTESGVENQYFWMLFTRFEKSNPANTRDFIMRKKFKICNR